MHRDGWAVVSLFFYVLHGVIVGHVTWEVRRLRGPELAALFFIGCWYSTVGTYIKGVI